MSQRKSVTDTLRCPFCGGPVETRRGTCLGSQGGWVYLCVAQCSQAWRGGMPKYRLLWPEGRREAP